MLMEEEEEEEEKEEEEEGHTVPYHSRAERGAAGHARSPQQTSIGSQTRHNAAVGVSVGSVGGRLYRAKLLLVPKSSTSADRTLWYLFIRESDQSRQDHHRGSIC
ncbi:hypothetical protein O3P69_012248 [Scylla paramamosain]|uniref:Uncharacterized protein n=1 Tax=Scylla paramamosain TaxID=85552 RepID=A0AAW0TCK9_SCYPA